METINKDLYAKINDGYHLVNEITETLYYFGIMERKIHEDQEGHKYIMFGGSAIYIDSFKRGKLLVSLENKPLY